MSGPATARVDWSDSYETIAKRSPRLANVARASVAALVSEPAVDRIDVRLWSLDGEREALTFTVWTELETGTALTLSDRLAEAVEAIERDHGVTPGDSAIVVHWRREVDQ